MLHCIPDELFNRIPNPADAYSDADGTPLVGIDGICREIHYKLPNAEDVVVRREVWHTLCDFCYRTGAFVERLEAEQGSNQILLASQQGKFMRIVGAEVNGEPTTAFTVAAGEGGLYANFGSGIESCSVLVSIRPAFDDTTSDGSGDWTPRVPRYLIDRYGECIAHGALARLFAMRGEDGMARMHATAYNNDLNRLSFGLITAGMRKHLLIDVEDWLVNTGASANGNG